MLSPIQFNINDCIIPKLISHFTMPKLFWASLLQTNDLKHANSIFTLQLPLDPVTTLPTQQREQQLTNNAINAQESHLTITKVDRPLPRQHFPPARLFLFFLFFLFFSLFRGHQKRTARSDQWGVGQRQGQIGGGWVFSVSSFVC